MRVVSPSCREKLVISDGLPFSIMRVLSWLLPNHGRVSVYIAYTEQMFVEQWN